MTAIADPALTDERRAKRNVAVLVAAQAVLGSQMPMIFTVGGLAGGMLAPNPCLATLPISLIVFGSMTTAPWLSPLMQRHGRRTGFVIGAMGGALGALVSAYGLFAGSFVIFLIGSYLTGVYMSAQGFFRFAAADTASESYRPKAISYVMAGGLLSALIGPPLGTALADSYVIPFFGTYLAVAAINVLGAFLFVFLDIPRPKTTAKGAAGGRTIRQLLADPKISVAIICAMVSYALMNLVMTSTPLAVVGCGFSTETAGWVVSAHVIAMFAPSFFTGHLIVRFGVRNIVSLGLLILAAAGVVALEGVEIGNFFGALILLGIGWNFGFIGATTMLAQAHGVEERGRVQGLNDAIVFGCVTVASLASGGLMNCSGGDVVQGWTAVNLAMVPFLTLAGAALIWLNIRNRAPA
ncbi:MFS transporter [Actibacterium sp. 188UL27-1]|uniref:MFS transporter n=1 Tax=Actibacterium sp. 188UL27-1 TaxID=2786961 RepID=UPI00195CA444|nr:MFS transporter [Actibacterium sp. 188UL27-1]MBM7067327.1 MFS transporter [Actibacterium sp. 188UL27-1]